MEKKDLNIKKYSFPSKLTEIIKEKKIKTYSFKNFNKEINWFTDGENIWINWDKDFYTKRFSVWHELSHIVLWHEFWDSKEEKEADEYAYDLLIDEKEFKEKAEICGWTAFDLQSYFWVPYKEIQKFAKSRFGRVF